MSDIRVHIEEDERYPCYFLTEGEYGNAVDVDEGTLASWRSAIALFEAVQEEMEEAFEAADRARPEPQNIAFAEGRVFVAPVSAGPFGPGWTEIGHTSAEGVGP